MQDKTRSATDRQADCNDFDWLDGLPGLAAELTYQKFTICPLVQVDIGSTKLAGSLAWVIAVKGSVLVVLEVEEFDHRYSYIRTGDDPLS